MCICVCIHSFIYFSVDLLQDMEIVMSIIVQEKEKNSSIQYIHVKLYQYV